MSVSKAGTLRGIHFADVPPGQAKYVTCPAGAVIDFIIDVRVGSPTFGAVDAVRLDTVDRRAVYLSEGFGHGFLALEDGSTLTYLCSTGLRARPRARASTRWTRRWNCRCRTVWSSCCRTRTWPPPRWPRPPRSGLLPSWDDLPGVHRQPLTMKAPDASSRRPG